MTALAKTAGPGRPKDLEKRAAILEAAKRLFIGRGFEATSMDAVAQEAGVSKLTVYNHFTDKDTLFLAAVESKCEEQLPHDFFVERREGSIKQQLVSIARAFVALINSDEAVAVYRMIAAESRQSSRLGQLFYDAGPRRTLNEFETFLRAANESGELEVPDPERAASHFFCMLKGKHHMCLLLGSHAPPTPSEVELHVKSVVDMFLRAFTPRR